MILAHTIAVFLALVIDRFIGDPKWLPHPVVGMGKLISFFEKRLNVGNFKKLKGVLFLCFVLTSVVCISIIVVYVAYQIHFITGIIAEALLISTTIASKSLEQAAVEVADPLQQDDLPSARLKLSWIVGRDTELLQESEIVRGTVETVAENTTDGVTSPLFYAMLGGAPLAMLYRAVNTCDSMVGYKNEKFGQFGWASARFDDVLNWIPSRLTGLLMVISFKPEPYHTRRECFAVLFRDAKKHPSPNSGWGEAAVAALLGIQLGGQNTYHGVLSNRAKMGVKHRDLKTKDIYLSIKIMKRTVYLFTLFLLVVGSVVYGIT
ncbi:adenosylcobinamide-phosphate synthase CbiB [Anaerobacillus sp. MEB173]|uniref:adenosylcobinamide-phosphate synthase CbiB n=1 Tax=Anaerobacillus sp. MEB173 TaxID=3383345 RepID=UPI003F938363